MVTTDGAKTYLETNAKSNRDEKKSIECLFTNAPRNNRPSFHSPLKLNPPNLRREYKS